MIVCPRCGTGNVESARFCNSCGNALDSAVLTPAEVRKTVTIMFMDAAGSTAITERSDPEAMRPVMTRYFDEIRDIVERHGGVVEKYIGDAVMAVFGVPAVHEDDPLRAVRAASEIRTRVAELRPELERERGLSIAWRTGINTGEVVAGDAGHGQRFVSGDAVNVAARLEQAAPPGAILIGAETYQLVRDDVSAQPTEDVPAKGKSEPVPAYRLHHVAARRHPVRRLDSPMVGRQRQRRLLADAFDQAVEDRVCHLFTVLGLAGVGKSRLVSEFIAALEEPTTVLQGRCLSYGEGITYWPVAEAIRDAAEIEEGDSDEIVRDKLGVLVDNDADRPLVVERISALLGRHAGQAAAEETSWAVRMLLESLARRQPVVFVFDDVHWAEPALLDLIEHLADWISEAPVLLVCLARQELLEARPGWGGGKTRATTITLEPLSDGESQELVGNLLGRVELGDQLAARVIASAEGNPLFVEEMISMLIDNGLLAPSDGGWIATADLAEVTVPPTIAALLAARLDQLSRSERAVIERGAVEGKVFHRGAVAELAPEEVRASVVEQLHALSRKELVRPDRSDFAGDEAYRFRHLLIRDAVYAAMPKEARAELHARFADWLERTAGDHVTEYEEILGYHLEQAHRFRLEVGRADDVATALATRASVRLGNGGRRALDRGDVVAARKLLATATELLPKGDALRIRLRADLATTYAQSGELSAAHEQLRETVEEASQGDDPSALAYAELLQLDVATSLSTLSAEEQIARCGELLAILEAHGDQRGRERATNDLARYQFFAGRAKLAEDILQSAIDSLAAGGATAPLTAWLPPILLWGPTPVEEATPRVEELLRAAESRSAEALALACSGMLRAFVGEFDEGRQAISRALAMSHELGQHVVALSMEGNFLGGLEMLAGNSADAERVLAHAFSGLEQAGERGFASTVAGLFAQTHILLGNLDDALRLARLAGEMSPPDDIDAQTRSLRAHARVLAARGDAEAAMAHARRAIALVEPTDYLELRGETCADLAEVLVAAGDRVAAGRAWREAISNFDAKGALVQAARTRGRMAEVEASAG